MPFTLAHPAAVLPLRGIRFLRMAPLVIGALTPDVPYYLPLGPSGRPLRLGLDTHSLVSAFTVDLALGMALLGPIADAPEDEWDRMLAVNVCAVLTMTRAALRCSRRAHEADRDH